MIKELIGKSKVIYKIDSYLKNILSKKYDFNVPTIPGVPYTMNIINVSVIRRLENLYPGRGIKMLICAFDDCCDKSRWLIDKNEYLKLGKRLFKEKSFVDKLEKDFKDSSKAFYSFIRYLENNGIEHKKLEKDFLRLLDLYLSQFGIVYAVTGPVTFGFSDYFLLKFLKKYNYSDCARKAIKKFTRSPQNFLLYEENDLRKILKRISKKKIQLSNLEAIKINHKDIYDLLSRHQRNYYWILNNYKDTRRLGINFFFNKLKRLAKDEKIKTSREKISPNEIYRKIDREDIKNLKLLGRIAGLQDLRKKSNIITNYWLMGFLKKIAEKYKIDFHLLQRAVIVEILALLETGKINRKILEKRKSGMINFSFPTKEYILTGKDFKIVSKILNSMFTKENDNILKGLTGNPGIAVGRARIVINAIKDGKKIKKGDILVTSMTRPEFVPYLKLTSGIVTDEGGITSHAVIVSRELGVPCIIATKMATQVLKDGDLVEVDANKGIVKVLKKGLTK